MGGANSRLAEAVNPERARRAGHEHHVPDAQASGAPGHDLELEAEARAGSGGLMRVREMKDPQCLRRLAASGARSASQGDRSRRRGRRRPQNERFEKRCKRSPPRATPSAGRAPMPDARSASIQAGWSTWPSVRPGGHSNRGAEERGRRQDRVGRHGAREIFRSFAARA